MARLVPRKHKKPPLVPSFEADVHRLIDSFALRVQAGAPLTLATFKEEWRSRAFSFVHQAVPLNVPPWDFLQLLYAVALNRLADPSPYLEHRPAPGEQASPAPRAAGGRGAGQGPRRVSEGGREAAATAASTGGAGGGEQHAPAAGAAQQGPSFGSHGQTGAGAGPTGIGAANLPAGLGPAEHEFLASIDEFLADDLEHLPHHQQHVQEALDAMHAVLPPPPQQQDQQQQLALALWQPGAAAGPLAGLVGAGAAELLGAAADAAAALVGGLPLAPSPHHMQYNGSGALGPPYGHAGHAASWPLPPLPDVAPQFPAHAPSGAVPAAGWHEVPTLDGTAAASLLPSLLQAQLRAGLTGVALPQGAHAEEDDYDATVPADVQGSGNTAGHHATLLAQPTGTSGAQGLAAEHTRGQPQPQPPVDAAAGAHGAAPGSGLTHEQHAASMSGDLFGAHGEGPIPGTPASSDDCRDLLSPLRGFSPLLGLGPSPLRATPSPLRPHAPLRGPLPLMPALQPAAAQQLLPGPWGLLAGVTQQGQHPEPPQHSHQQLPLLPWTVTALPTTCDPSSNASAPAEPPLTLFAPGAVPAQQPGAQQAGPAPGALAFSVPTVDAFSSAPTSEALPLLLHVAGGAPSGPALPAQPRAMLPGAAGPPPWAGAPGTHAQGGDTGGQLGQAALPQAAASTASNGPLAQAAPLAPHAAAISAPQHDMPLSLCADAAHPTVAEGSAAPGAALAVVAHGMNTPLAGVGGGQGGTPAAGALAVHVPPMMAPFVAEPSPSASAVAPPAQQPAMLPAPDAQQAALPAPPQLPLALAPPLALPAPPPQPQLDLHAGSPPPLQLTAPAAVLAELGTAAAAEVEDAVVGASTAAAAPHPLAPVRLAQALPPPGPDVPLAARAGAVFAVLCLHGTQLCQPRVRAYVPYELLSALAGTVRDAAAAGARDVVAAAQDLWRQRALVPGGVVRYPGATTTRPRALESAAFAAAARARAAMQRQQQQQQGGAAAAQPAARPPRSVLTPEFNEVLMSNPVFRQSLLHLRTALPGLADFASVERACDEYAAQREAVFAGPGGGGGGGGSGGGSAVPDVLFDAGVGRRIRDMVGGAFAAVLRALRQPPASRRRAEERRRQREEEAAEQAEEEARAAAAAAAAPRTVAEALASVAARPPSGTGRRVAGELGALMRRRAAQSGGAGGIPSGPGGDGGPAAPARPHGVHTRVTIVRHRPALAAAGLLSTEDEESLAARAALLPGVPQRLLQMEDARRQHVAAVADKWLTQQDRQMRREALQQHQQHRHEPQQPAQARRQQQQQQQQQQHRSQAPRAQAAGCQAGVELAAQARDAGTEGGDSSDEGSDAELAAAFADYEAAASAGPPDAGSSSDGSDGSGKRRRSKPGAAARARGRGKRGSGGGRGSEGAAQGAEADAQPSGKRARRQAGAAGEPASYANGGELQPQAERGGARAAGARGGGQRGDTETRQLADVHPTMDVCCNGMAGRMDTRTRTIRCECDACAVAAAFAAAAAAAPSQAPAPAAPGQLPGVFPAPEWPEHCGIAEGRRRWQTHVQVVVEGGAEKVGRPSLAFFLRRSKLVLGRRSAAPAAAGAAASGADDSSEGSEEDGGGGGGGARSRKRPRAEPSGAAKRTRGGSAAMPSAAESDQEQAGSDGGKSGSAAPIERPSGQRRSRAQLPAGNDVGGRAASARGRGHGRGRGRGRGRSSAGGEEAAPSGAAAAATRLPSARAAPSAPPPAGPRARAAPAGAAAATGGGRPSVSAPLSRGGSGRLGSDSDEDMLLAELEGEEAEVVRQALLAQRELQRELHGRLPAGGIGAAGVGGADGGAGAAAARQQEQRAEEAPQPPGPLAAHAQPQWPAQARAREQDPQPHAQRQPQRSAGGAEAAPRAPAARKRSRAGAQTGPALPLSRGHGRGRGRGAGATGSAVAAAAAAAAAVAAADQGQAVGPDAAAELTNGVPAKGSTRLRARPLAGRAAEAAGGAQNGAGTASGHGASVLPAGAKGQGAAIATGGARGTAAGAAGGSRETADVGSREEGGQAGTAKARTDEKAQCCVLTNEASNKRAVRDGDEEQDGDDADDALLRDFDACFDALRGVQRS